MGKLNWLWIKMHQELKFIAGKKKVEEACSLAGALTGSSKERERKRKLHCLYK